MHIIAESVSPLRLPCVARTPLAKSRRAAASAMEMPAVEPRPVACTPEADWLMGAFEPISLGQLNAKATMLERRDNKYVVQQALLRKAVGQLAEHFDILEIDGKRVFTYETCYFDDAERSNYFDQLHGRRQRCKVRTRRYADSGLCYVEFKLKDEDKGGVTIKERLAYPLHKYGTLDESAWSHIRAAYRKLCASDFDRSLEPVVEIRYQRMTLVARQGGERMTIDQALVFEGLSGARTTGEQLFIVECKSANADGIADQILRGLGQEPIDSCSKYCIALAALGEVQEYDKFLPVLQVFDMLPPVGAASR